MAYFFLLFIIYVATLPNPSTPSPLAPGACKVFPGDARWPSEQQWQSLNASTNGALIKTVPIGASCYHGPQYDAQRCDYITKQWTNSSIHMMDPTSMMSPVWQGLTCQPPLISPTAASNNKCTLGGFPSYAINASGPADIQAAIKFVQDTGIRLVIKNTGPDFSGKSGGAGALSIWTHHLKKIEYIASYVGGDGEYSGPAFRAGSGIQAWELYDAAHAKSLIVVGGEGRTVGVVGGYILGGGHSPLSSIYGIAADHVLELEVVLASGEVVNASSSANKELFWALRGGGGSTFGVVTSVVIKAYPEFPVTAGSFDFGGPQSKVTYDNFWAAVRAYFSHVIPFTDAGVYTYLIVSPGPVPTFSMRPFFVPNMTVEATRILLKPWFTELAQLGINISPNFTEYPEFYTAWMSSFPQEAVGTNTGFTGSRLFPRKNWQNEESLNATFNAFKESIDAGMLSISFNMAPRAKGTVDNSVNPAWRETVMHSIQLLSWADNATVADIKAARQLMTDRQTAWQKVSPGAGSYLSESDRGENSWQQSFYGSYYEQLLKIKKSVDPDSLFWAKTAVGSESMEVKSKDSVADENGPLCAVS